MKSFQKKFKKFISRFKSLKFDFAILSAFVLVGIIVVLYFFVIKDIPSTASIGTTSYPQSTKIYDRNNKLLYTVFSSRNQTFIPFDKIPQNLKNATIAIEDRDFYKHGAIDIRGIIRAAFSILLKKQVQGGSTITQQLVKATLLTPEQTITRKIKEIILSFIVESVYSKNKILEMYLNQVSYGGTAWGVQAASNVYFDKPADKLDIAEAAFLAGLPQAPSIYSPFGSHPEEGRARQLEVLRAMLDQKYITAEQEKKAAAETLKFSSIQNKILAPHFVFYVKDLLVQKYGAHAVEQGGLNVVTSLDLDVQNTAQASVSGELDKLNNATVTNGAAMVTVPATGEILAMVGSRDYFDDAHDGNVNVAISRRQPGSSIKPINYATGLIKGYTAATPFIDESKCFPNVNGQPDYCPLNYDNKFHGVQQMRFALANSFNVPAVKMLKLNGVADMIATASAMGITTFDSPDRYGLSLTLGGGEVLMTQMSEAFGVFANGGYRIPLQPILKVTDAKGKVLEQYKPPTSPIFGRKIFDSGVAYIISQILSDNGARAQEFGTNSPLQIGKYPVSVKTGTTNDFRDNWTIGYTPSYVVAVWVGNNNNKPMSGIVSGITGAAPIWHDIMAHLIQNKPPEPVTRPDDIVGKIICSTSGLIPQADGSPDKCPTRFEYFIKGTEPKQVDPGKQNVLIDKGTQDLAKAGQTDNTEMQSHLVVTDPVGDRFCLDCPHPELLSPTPSPTPHP
ncbi:MAG TPA: transglycosylase domain-containing protein [Patescibacteria group bacterium]|nr:transglycosylase domain-containing protein [Patescibacteria group bacterium]